MNVRALEKCTDDRPDEVENILLPEEQNFTVENHDSTKSSTEDTLELKSDGVDHSVGSTKKTLKPPVLEKVFALYKKTDSLFIGVLSISVGLVLWHLATIYSFNFYINFQNIPTPLSVGSAFITQLADTEFYIHILVSLKRILVAYSIAVFLGVGTGLVIGRSRMMRAAVLPYIEIIRPIPAVAWIPLAILMWPTEESSIVYITFLGALFPIILSTVHGVEQTPEVLVRAALSLGAKRSKVFLHVVLPAALPSIASGLAIGMGVSWFSLLAGEVISGQYGIGYFTWNAYSLINYPDIVVGMLVIGALGSLSTFLVRLIMRPSLRWTLPRN